MYVGLKQPRGDGERYVTPARAAAKETIERLVGLKLTSRNSELIFRKRNPLALFLDRSNEFNFE